MDLNPDMHLDVTTNAEVQKQLGYANEDICELVRDQFFRHDARGRTPRVQTRVGCLVCLFRCPVV